MEFLHSFLGTWEITECRHLYYNRDITKKVEGVKFRLDENGDVTWTIPSEELKSVPLFSCETYELYESSSALRSILRFGAYAGHILEFKCILTNPEDEIVMTCENWCNLKCKRVYEENDENQCCVPFSLLPALEDGYFSDITLTSLNKKQFKVHSSILKLMGSDIDWNSDISLLPFNNLPEDVLGTILHFLYAECLPENLSEATVQQVINAVTQYPSMSKLVNKCNLYLKNMALKQQIIELVSDMHGSMNQIIDHFSPRTNPASSDNFVSNPAKLCFVVKQSIRDFAVAGVKLLLLCDLFTKRKNELSKEERNEIIRYAKSRLPVFLGQLQRFFQALKNTFGSMSAAQRLEVARFLLPEIEVMLDTLPVLFVQIEKALQQIIQELSPNESSSSKTEVGDISRSLRIVLHLKELAKIKNLHEDISGSLSIFIHNREDFKELPADQKVRSIARNLEQLIGELPLFLLRLEEVSSAFDEKLEWREFKFCFKVGTSKVSRALQKLVNHRDVLQEVIVQLCELIQRDAFNQSLQALGLLETPSSSSTTNEFQRIPSSSNSTPKYLHSYKLNLVESFCIPPYSNVSTLSKLSLELFQKSDGADMEFEVIGSCNNEQGDSESPSDDEECIIKAHRVIVAARCDWFRRALLSGMREAIDKKIIIHDTSPQLFRIFLEYLYSGRLRQESLSIEQLVELLLLSDRYEVDSLKHACEYILQQSIDVDSALYFFNMADQYNARILRSACLNFIAQHHELTECEIFFELPMALQAEITDCVWTQPPPQKSGTMEQLLPSSVTPTSPDSSTSERQKMGEFRGFHSDYHRSNSSSIEDLPLAQDAERMDSCISQLRDIVGESVPREQLVQVILAADYDLCRAVNFYYVKNPEEE